MTVGQWRGVGRAVIGLVSIVIGVGRQIDSPTYPAGDWRADPTVSAIVNSLVVLFGAILILSALIPLIRESR